MANFKDLTELGRGGFGIVCKCIRESDGVLFARKTLMLDDAGSVKRFRREVRLVQKLKHQGIVKIVSTHLERPPYWYVMPHYQGSLLQVIPELHLNKDRALRIFGKILEAIEYAHKEEVIHRDLKPENILLDMDESPIVTDFGLGRALDALTSRATGTGAWVGTLGYMAPEQMDHAAHADARSDIFALGRMLYEMMTSEPRWAVQDLTKLPVGISEIVQKCTLTDPDERFQTVSDVRKALSLITSKHPQAEQSLDRLVQKVADQKFFTAGDIEELARLIGVCHEQSELLHEVAIRIPVQAFVALDSGFPEMSKLLARRFAERSMERGWDFSFTDTLGSTCAKLHGATTQLEVKGLMAATALEVGASHNRFYVLDVAASLIAAAKDDSEALAVAHALRTQKGNLEAIQARLTVWKLHPNLAELFGNQEK